MTNCPCLWAGNPATQEPLLPGVCGDASSSTLLCSWTCGHSAGAPEALKIRALMEPVSRQDLLLVGICSYPREARVRVCLGKANPALPIFAFPGQLGGGGEVLLTSQWPSALTGTSHLLSQTPPQFGQPPGALWPGFMMGSQLALHLRQAVKACCYYRFCKNKARLFHRSSSSLARLC